MMENVLTKCSGLKLGAFAENLERVLDESSKKNWPCLKTIDHLLDLELEKRRLARIDSCFRNSRLSEKSTIENFDFSFTPSRKESKARILKLLDLEFIKDKKDIIFIGTPGGGKTFLAKCIAYAATQTGVKTLFTTTMEMINQLLASDPKMLVKKLAYYNSFDLLVCDEIGYLPLGKAGASMFFQVISHRHLKASTIITSNLIFSEWGNIFDDSVIATAIADRLVENSEIIILEGGSYRKRDKKQIRKLDAIGGLPD
jgi:DNA replication protein DnaC